MAPKALVVLAMLSLLSAILIQDVESLTEDDYRLLLRDARPKTYPPSLPIGKKRVLQEEESSICRKARSIGC
ncbi:hypothetical protein AC249_AIPGENE13374 [Exaiptasia diaphana]|nr:hypothetical protein AC249_AIPGENE13374 [Exaiptasia diaphana]